MNEMEIDGFSRRAIEDIIEISDEDEADRAAYEASKKRNLKTIRVKKEKRDLGVQIVSNDVIRRQFMPIQLPAQNEVDISTSNTEFDDECNNSMAMANETSTTFFSTSDRTPSATVVDNGDVELPKTNDFLDDFRENQCDNVNANTLSGINGMHDDIYVENLQSDVSRASNLNSQMMSENNSNYMYSTAESELNSPYAFLEPQQAIDMFKKPDGSTPNRFTTHGYSYNYCQVSPVHNETLGATNGLVYGDDEPILNRPTSGFSDFYLDNR